MGNPNLCTKSTQNLELLHFISVMEKGTHPRGPMPTFGLGIPATGVRGALKWGPKV